MPNFELTGTENLAFSRAAAQKMCELDKNKNYPLLGKIGARVAGPALLLLTSIVDSIFHACLAVLKATIALPLAPYNTLALCFFPGMALPKDLEITSVFIHLFRMVEKVFFAATLPLITLINPKKALALTNFGVEKAEKEIQLKKVDDELKKKDDELLKLEIDINLLREKIQNSGSSESKNDNKDSDKFKKDIKNLYDNKPKQVLSYFDLNEKARSYFFKTFGDNIDAIEEALSTFTPEEIEEISRDNKNDLSDLFSEFGIEEIQDEELSSSLVLEYEEELLEIELDNSKPKISYFDLSEDTKLHFFRAFKGDDNAIEKALLSFTPDEIEEISRKNKNDLSDLFAECGFEEIPSEDNARTIVMDGQMYTQDEYDAIVKESSQITIAPKKKFKFEVDTNPKPITVNAKLADKIFERKPLPEPKKINFAERKLNPLNAALQKKKVASDELKMTKLEPSQGDFAKRALDAIQGKLEVNREETKVERSQKTEVFLADQKEKLNALKPKLNNMLSELKTASSKTLKKVILPKKEEKKEVEIFDLSIKERAEALNVLIKKNIKVDEVKKSPSDAEMESKSSNSNEGESSGEIRIVDGIAYDEYDYELAFGKQGALIDDMDFFFPVQESKSEPEVLQMPSALPLNTLKEPTTLLEDANEILASMFDTQLSWKKPNQAVLLKKRLDNLYKTLTSVAVFNIEWKQKTSFPSPYGDVENKILKLITAAEMDCFTSPFNSDSESYDAIYGKLNEEGLPTSLILQFEQLAGHLAQICLQKHIATENPHWWENGINKLNYLKAYKSLLEIEKLLPLSRKFFGIGQKAKEILMDFEAIAPKKMENLPFDQIVSPAEYAFPLTKKLRQEVESIKKETPKRVEDVLSLTRKLQTIKQFWKSQGEALTLAIDKFGSIIEQRDYEYFVTFYPTLGQAVKDLNTIRLAILEVRNNPDAALSNESKNKLTAAAEAFARIRNIKAPLDDLENNLLEEIYQEAASYMETNYSPELIRSDKSIDKLMRDLKTDYDGDMDKHDLVSMLKDLVAYKAQWNYENKMLAIC